MILLFNEKINLNSKLDRSEAHKIIDELFYLVTYSVDGVETVQLPEYIDFNDLSFNNDLDMTDFNIDIDKISMKELEKEKKEIHSLISNKNKKGLINYNSYLPLKITEL